MGSFGSQCEFSYILKILDVFGVTKVMEGKVLGITIFVAAAISTFTLRINYS